MHYILDPHSSSDDECSLDALSSLESYESDVLDELAEESFQMLTADFEYCA
jgi:hypothetical protein